MKSKSRWTDKINGTENLKLITIYYIEMPYMISIIQWKQKVFSFEFSGNCLKFDWITLFCALNVVKVENIVIELAMKVYHKVQKLL